MKADYIIVGAGSAGCVLANRLSADPKNRVLLVEAGGKDNHWLLRMPLGFMRAYKTPHFLWHYETEPEPSLNNRRIAIPRGRVLGGSSSINGLFFMRGHSLDFDTWRQMGCEGWGHADVLPYFKKMERSWRGAGPYHGDSGPLPVVPVDTSRLLHEPLMQTAEAAGFGTTEDLHGEVEEGFARGELTIDEKGRRASTSRAYLTPALARPNLTVVTGALTRRVVIENGRATGIEVHRDGKTEQYHAEKEVILCGGSYNSPQLLMLSGIGPGDHLREHGIEPVADRPMVGRNLQEHPRVPVHFAMSKPASFLNELRFDKVALSVIRWALTGRGAFATQVNSANPILKSQPDLAQPDLQIWANPIRMDAKIWFPGFGERQEHRMTADVILLHPRSAGWVRLRSADPGDSPAVTLNIFSEPEDFETARRGIEIVRRIYSTPPQSEFTGREIVPGAELDDPSALDTYIRENAMVTQHPVGTCAMGASPDTVCDPQLRVRGVAGLRVVDASVMPTVPGANTNGPTIMIAEKAADLILGRPSLPAEDPRTLKEAAA
ncbi:GMC family oxidoreductase [Parasphingopyxis marina]|uniref:GMC family oxidoreductase N-terminal domain-containing protein n=1 Tax=Parasphingopyxis marina TaxID=2761622 RepID=A0A842HWX5_9SPHN|nr:GMC family oxidoreductase N-terminal domain-containing protein [Parasphingopyxis marina]MBC2776014.1 GMC family oxidoreductase N-terminal domain-containing protein [Parasphingopyxis marina]